MQCHYTIRGSSLIKSENQAKNRCSKDTRRIHRQVSAAILFIYPGSFLTTEHTEYTETESSDGYLFLPWFQCGSGSPAEIRLFGFSPEGDTSLPLVRKPPDLGLTPQPHKPGERINHQLQNSHFLAFVRAQRPILRRDGKKLGSAESYNLPWLDDTIGNYENRSA